MGFEITEKAQEYRLLMIQPDPENGERVCVGIVFEDDVVYDAKLSRLRCVSQGFDISVARFYLSEIRDNLRRSRGLNIQQVLTAYAPIFSYSAARRVASPVTETTKATLLRRFVIQENGLLPLAQAGEVSSERQVFSTKLRGITSQYLEESFDHVIENAKVSDVLGYPYPGIGRVALALKRLDKIVVIDGIDLHSINLKKAIAQSAKVVHTFWQYKRISAQRVFRVAVVFSDLPRDSAIDRDTHDFVFEHFQFEADKTIEGSSLDFSRQVSDLFPS